MAEANSSGTAFPALGLAQRHAVEGGLKGTGDMDRTIGCGLNGANRPQPRPPTDHRISPAGAHDVV